MAAKSRDIPLWVVSGLVALTFMMTGSGKLLAMPPSPENFARWGLSTTLMYVVGAAEVAGAIGLLIPRVAPFAALGLAATMLGAVRTGVVFSEPMHVALLL